MQQLGDAMTAQEFGQHYVLELEEPVPRASFMVLSRLLAAIANGPLQAPAAGRLWGASDFMPDLWQHLDDSPAGEQEAADPLTIDQIMARARVVGMVH